MNWIIFDDETSAVNFAGEHPGMVVVETMHKSGIAYNACDPKTARAFVLENGELSPRVVFVGTDAYPETMQIAWEGRTDTGRRAAFMLETIELSIPVKARQTKAQKMQASAVEFYQRGYYRGCSHAAG